MTPWSKDDGLCAAPSAGHCPHELPTGTRAGEVALRAYGKGAPESGRREPPGEEQWTGKRARHTDAHAQVLRRQH